MMVKKKKITQAHEQQAVLNQHKDRSKKFLGHFRKATQGRLQAKKIKAKKGRVRI